MNSPWPSPREAKEEARGLRSGLRPGRASAELRREDETELDAGRFHPALASLRLGQGRRQLRGTTEKVAGVDFWFYTRYPWLRDPRLRPQRGRPVCVNRRLEAEEEPAEHPRRPRQDVAEDTRQLRLTRGSSLPKPRLGGSRVPDLVAPHGGARLRPEQGPVWEDGRGRGSGDTAGAREA